MTLSAFALLLPFALSAQTDSLKALGSKDPAERQTAAEALAGDDSKKVTDALLRVAGKDDDPLVVLATLASLSGREASSGYVKRLTSLALESPFARIRKSAASALGSVDPEVAREKFLKKASGRTLVRGAQALACALEAIDDVEPREAKDVARDVKKLDKAIKSKDPDEQAAATRAVLALSRAHAESRSSAREELLISRASDPRNAVVVCAALESTIDATADGDLEALTPLLAEPALPSVVERRLERAIAARLARVDASRQREFFDAQREAYAGHNGPGGARLARIAGLPGLDDGVARTVLAALLLGESVGTRAAAARALGRFGEAAAELALARLEDEEDAPPRRALVELLGRHGAFDAEDDEPSATVQALAAVLADTDEDRLVRTQAALALGRPGIAGGDALEVLASVGKQEAGTALGTTCLVSLGRTRSPEAVAPLAELTTHDDWTVRGSAAAGLEQVSTPECVAPLLPLLDDINFNVAETAHRALLRFAGREGQQVDPATWPEWWETNLKKARFRTRDEVRQASEKYGYDVPDTLIYRGLDVIVVPGRGDQIEDVLDRMEIEYRTVRAGDLQEGRLHPGAILLVGCTGEIGPLDVEVVRWFVQSGGALFTSCWALTHTVEESFPAIIRKFPSPGEVVDNVFARPTADAIESPYLHGVFDGDVQPFYSLLGAHLIEVVDPERVTVLLDSPTAAARHGTGDLAAWFRVGHGVVLDTANHFAEQGFSSAEGLDDAVDRQAFAVDHMGFSPLELRKIQGEGWWRSTSKTAQHVADLSVFRILTNFVREKRIRG